MCFWFHYSVVTVAYCDKITYHNSVNNTSSPIFNFIELLSLDGISQKIYQNRTLILKNTLQPQNMIMDCVYSIQWLIENLLMPNTVSYNVKYRCATCEWIYKETTCIICLMLFQIASKELKYSKNWQSSIDLKFAKIQKSPYFRTLWDTDHFLPSEF